MMNFEAELPLRFWINLGRREDRRHETEARLAEANIVAERLPAVQVKNKGEDLQPLQIDLQQEPRPQTNGLGKRLAKEQEPLVRGYASSGRYSLALTQRLAIREARRRGAPAVLLLEDDIVFHPNFSTLIEAVELPEDWGIFYLGCAHSERPEWAGRRVVRCRYAVDTHAVAIRAPFYDRVMEMLDRHGKPELNVAKASDQFLALLHEEIPSYACYPNLAWQDLTASDLARQLYSNYHRDGRQKNWVESVTGLLDEAVHGQNGHTETPPEGKEHADPAPNGAPKSKRRRPLPKRPEPKLGLLFLTRGDVNHPEIWREFVDEAEGRVRVFCHPKYPAQIAGGFLDKTAIKARFETKWGDISLVRASRAMLLAALEDESLTHFALLSEACVPILPSPQILRRLKLDPRPQFGFKTLKEAVPRHTSRIGAVPEVPAACWRFTSQWWLMDRTAAVMSAAPDYTPLFERMFVPDEAYFATVLSMQGYPLEGEVIKKDITWTWWEKDAGSPTEWPCLPLGQFERMLHSGAFFARKFPKDADISQFRLHKL